VRSQRPCGGTNDVDLVAADSIQTMWRLDLHFHVLAQRCLKKAFCSAVTGLGNSTYDLAFWHVSLISQYDGASLNNGLRSGKRDGGCDSPNTGSEFPVREKALDSQIHHRRGERQDGQDEHHFDEGESG